MPVKELDSLETRAIHLKPAVIDSSLIIMENNPTAKVELIFKKPMHGSIKLRFSNIAGEYVDVGYDTKTAVYYIDRSNSGKVDFNNEFAGKHLGTIDYEADDIQLLIYLDHASIELFADHGRCVMTEIFFPSKPLDKAEIISNNEPIELKQGKVSTFKSIWMVSVK